MPTTAFQRSSPTLMLLEILAAGRNGSGDMFISYPKANMGNSCLGYAKQKANLSLAFGWIAFQHLSNLIIRKFSAPHTTWLPASLAYRVAGILTGRAYPKMIGVHTRRAVPIRAVVKHPQPIGDSSKMDDPAYSVRSHVDFGARPSHNGAIAVFVFVRSPKPARCGLFHLCPKAFENVRGISLRDHVGKIIFCVHTRILSFVELVCRAFGSPNREGIFFSTQFRIGVQS